MKGKKKMPISLIERVQSINRMNNAEREENKEQEVEQSMVEAVEQSWENAKAEEKKEAHTEVTIEMLYLEIQALTEVVEKQLATSNIDVFSGNKFDSKNNDA